jgi:hypothetical protein
LKDTFSHNISEPYFKWPLFNSCHQISHSCYVGVVDNMELTNVNKECLYWHDIHTKSHESYSEECRIRGITAAVTKSCIFWGVILCSLVKAKWCFHLLRGFMIFLISFRQTLGLLYPFTSTQFLIHHHILTNSVLLSHSNIK